MLFLRIPTGSALEDKITLVVQYPLFSRWRRLYFGKIIIRNFRKETLDIVRFWYPVFLDEENTLELWIVQNILRDSREILRQDTQRRTARKQRDDARKLSVNKIKKEIPGRVRRLLVPVEPQPIHALIKKEVPLRTYLHERHKKIGKLQESPTDSKTKDS